MAERYWNVDEANEALERVAAMVEQARQAVASMQERNASAREGAAGNGHAKKGTGEQDLQAVLDELAADGIVLRDIEQGLIDFPARAPSGREYWLCWLVGEPDVSWWHWPEDGFAGRTPLSQPPT